MSKGEGIALVFGGSSGIGAEVCKLLLQAGSKVCCADIQAGKESTGTLYDKAKYQYIKADVTKMETINAAFQKVQDEWGAAPDLVINCCGIVHEFNYERCIDVNFTGTVRTLIASLNHMGRDKGGKGGSYLVISSISALGISSVVPVYCGTKAAVNQLVRCYSTDQHFSNHGVRINTILPGVVKTPLQVAMTSDICFASLCPKHEEDHSLSPEAVAEQIVSMVRNPDMNGQCMLFTRIGGLEKVTFDKEDEYRAKTY